MRSQQRLKRQGVEKLGRPRKFKSKKALLAAWEEYKEYCDTRKAIKIQFNRVSGQYEQTETPKRVTYTINGFCVFSGISRQSFYDYYVSNSEFADTVTRMREECEVDAREKFELGEIPPQLAALWMSNYGYSTKTETNVASPLPIIISGEDDLEN